MDSSKVKGLEFRVLSLEGLRIRIWGLGSRVLSLGLRVPSFEFKVHCLRLRRQASGLKVDKYLVRLVGNLPSGAAMRSSRCFVPGIV